MRNQKDKLDFPTCYAIIDWEWQRIDIYFPDGSVAPAQAQDTEEYRQTAQEYTSTGNIWDQCRQHELAHILVGLARTKDVIYIPAQTSVVLWRVAHNLPTEIPECWEEEEQVRLLQKIWSNKN